MRDVVCVGLKAPYHRLKMDSGPATTSAGVGLRLSSPVQGDPGSPENSELRVPSAEARQANQFTEATCHGGVVASLALTLMQCRATVMAALPDAPVEPPDMIVIATRSCVASQLGARVLAPRAPSPLDLHLICVPMYAIPSFPLVFDVAPSDSYPCNVSEEADVFSRFLAEHLRVSASFCNGAAAAVALQPAFSPRGEGLPGIRVSFPAAWGHTDAGTASVIISADSMLLAGVRVYSPCLPASVPVGANHAKGPPGPLCAAIGEGDIAKVVAALSAGCSTEEGAYDEPGEHL